MPNQPMSYMAAMIHFFGVLPGQTNLQFGAEIKAVGCRDEFIAGLRANGYVITA